MSTFSLGMLVQVKCMQVSIPMSPWQVLTNSQVRSDVRPPAFLRLEPELERPQACKTGIREWTDHVISINSGPSKRIRSIRSYKFCKPWMHTLDQSTTSSEYSNHQNEPELSVEGSIRKTTTLGCRARPGRFSG